MERSGHLSTDGVRSYERTSVEQLKSVSEILSTTIPLPDASNEKENEDPNEDITEKAMELKPEPVDSSQSWWITPISYSGSKWLYIQHKCRHKVTGN